MRGLFFDTETNGLWNFKAPMGHSSQPDMVQLAALLVDIPSRKIITSLNLLVETDQPISQEAAAVHGKTKELLDQYGVPRRVAAAMFSNMAKKADIKIAHNIKFDLNIVDNSFVNEGIATQPHSKIFCTMEATTEICQLPNPRFSGKFKWPKLIEAYKILINPEGFDGAHDALADVKACMEIFFELVDRGVVDVSTL